MKRRQGTNVGLQLGLDTGGTYTDAVLVDESLNILNCAKSLTTHADLVHGLRGAVEQTVIGIDAKDIDLVCLSTTLATNALVEGRGRRVALILVGFNESLLKRANLLEALAGDPVLITPGGHKADGQVQQRLDLEQVRSFVDEVDVGVDAYAISAMFAVRNPQHEIQIQSLITSVTGKPATCGHHLSSGLDAPRRALTALLNARLIPMISALLCAARQLLEEQGINAPLMVVKGDGSLISDRVANEYPVETILSGPAASVVGAMFLCAEDELLVSDMGGTTTDIALIKNAQPRLNADGATVGGWRTMVRAIDVRTYGLGGDSAVLYERTTRTLSVGPNRVVPLSLLINQHPQCLAELEAQLALPFSTTHSAQFVMVHASKPADLSYQQNELFDQIALGPIALQTLFKDQTLERALQRLEQRGVVLRSGFTPSDASHLLGVQTTWSVEAAKLGAQLLIRYCRDNLGATYSDEVQFAQAVIHRVAVLTSIAMVDALSDAAGTRMNESQRVLIERSLNVDDDASFSLVPQLRVPVVGLGAPASSYYPKMADMLGAQLRLPEFAHVANALGAVAGTIKQDQLIVISPAGGKRVCVLFPDGPVEFEDLEQGVSAAVDAASRLAVAKACAAGALDSVVDIERFDNIVNNGDVQVLFECRITATAKGRPSV